MSLTPAGEERFRRLNDLLDAQAERIMARVSESERGTIGRSLETLRDALRREAAEGCR